MLKRTVTGDRHLVSKQKGFTLVELLVVVAIIVALAAASIVAVSQFSSKGEEGATAAELQAVQTAMDTMMADNGINAVTASVSLAAATSDFTTLPTEGPLVTYLRTNPVTYTYCWDATGKVSAVTGNCP